jgi:hypothetical protein
MAHPTVIGPRQQRPAAQRSVARSRRMPIKQRLLLVLIAFAIVLLALGGWAAQGLRLAVTAWQQ